MINFPLPGYDWRLVQRFGENPQVYAQFNLPGHNGIDCAPPVPGQTGVMVYAPHEGYVTVPAFDQHGYGNYVQIFSLPYLTTGEEHASTLAHFEKILVVDKQFVHQGDPVGIMGMTGFADGIHTHWTYKKRQNGVYIDGVPGYKGAIDILPFAAHWSLH